METVRKLWQKYRHLVIYVIFGTLTTVVNYAVYLPLYNWLHLSATVSDIIAWGVSVIFAYVTNKAYVFHSPDWSAKVVAKELVSFLGCRVVSGVIEVLILMLTVDILAWDGNWMKLITSMLVVFVNYFGSKFWVFKSR